MEIPKFLSKVKEAVVHLMPLTVDSFDQLLETVIDRGETIIKTHIKPKITRHVPEGTDRPVDSYYADFRVLTSGGRKIRLRDRYHTQLSNESADPEECDLKTIASVESRWIKLKEFFPAIHVYLLDVEGKLVDPVRRMATLEEINRRGIKPWSSENSPASERVEKALLAQKLFPA